MIKWRAMLQHYPNFAEEVLDPIVSRFISAPGLEEDKEHGLSDVEKTALISASFIEEKNDRCPKICNKIAIGMLVPLASEFFRNLGRPGFKPDRHIKTLLTLWMPNLPQAMKRAKQLDQRYFSNQSQERLRMLCYEIDERNRLRFEAGLPLLSVAKEVRKIYEARRTQDFERFVETTPLRGQIEDELLARQKLARHDPEWKPTGMLSCGGWAFYLEVRRRLRRHYLA